MMSSINGNPPRLCIDHLSPEIEKGINIYFCGGENNVNPENILESKDEIEKTKEQLVNCVNKVYAQLLTNPSATFLEEDFTEMPLDRSVKLVVEQLQKSGKIEKQLNTNIQFKTMGDTSFAFRVCRITFGK